MLRVAAAMVRGWEWWLYSVKLGNGQWVQVVRTGGMWCGSMGWGNYMMVTGLFSVELRIYKSRSEKRWWKAGR